MDDRIQIGKERDPITLASTLIDEFRSTDDLERKAEVARQLQSLQLKHENNKDFQKFMKAYAKGLRLDEWLKMHKAITDITEVGKTAQSQVQKTEFQPSRTLTELMEDQNLDPMARWLASRFNESLPTYNSIKDRQDFRNGEPILITQDETIVAKDKEYGGRTFSKDVVLDSQGKILMKPSGDSDPRGISTSPGQWKHFLVTKEKEESQKGGFYRDPLDILGEGVVTTLNDPDSSQLMKDTNRYLVDLAKQLEPKRTRDMVVGSEKRMNQQKLQNYKEDKEKGKNVQKPEKIKVSKTLEL